jgi:hypothetical protein
MEIFVLIDVQMIPTSMKQIEFAENLLLEQLLRKHYLPMSKALQNPTAFITRWFAQVHLLRQKICTRSVLGTIFLEGLIFGLMVTVTMSLL